MELFFAMVGTFIGLQILACADHTPKKHHGPRSLPMVFLTILCFAVGIFVLVVIIGGSE